MAVTMSLKSCLIAFFKLFLRFAEDLSNIAWSSVEDQQMVRYY